MCIFFQGRINIFKYVPKMIKPKFSIYFKNHKGYLKQAGSNRNLRVEVRYVKEVY